MSRWVHLLVFGATISLTKSAGFGFIKLVVLGGLGLAGLWMVHTLAQDFSSITQHGFGSAGGDYGGGGGGGATKSYSGLDQEYKVYKRSIGNSQRPPHIDWDMVIKRDPASCARSFICQLAASKEADLVYEERVILNLTRHAANEGSYAGRELYEALENGEATVHPQQCMKKYKFCPYTKKMMMNLLRFFGNR